jgi:hypothetical protein
MRDFVYKQNPDGSYLVHVDQHEKENRNDIIDNIMDVLEKIYSGIITANKVRPGKTDCNVHLLDQALTRYSRDIFGEKRLKERTNHLVTLGRITDAQYQNLIRFEDYGLKIDSCDPYLHRQIAYLLYWLSTLKPFSIEAPDEDIKKLGVAYEFHNEYISYCLILAMLKTFNQKLKLHENRHIFSDFLYDLHFRMLSRSSLEFFLNTQLVPV